jgi:hypothetical protein
MAFPGQAAPTKNGQSYYIASNTVRYSDPTDRVLATSPTTMLIAKFMPKYLGEIVIDVELQASGGASNASCTARTIGVTTAILTATTDWRTPIGTSGVSFTGYDSVSVGSTTNTTFTKVSVTIAITSLAPIYITATGQSPGYRARNLNISYDIV